MARPAAQTGDNDDRVDLGVPEPETTVKIDLKEPEEDEGGGDDDDEGGAAAAGGERQRGEDGKFTRAEKKRERGREGREFKNWRQEKADMEARVARDRQDYDRRFQQMQQEMDRLRQQPAGGGGQPADPYANAIGEVRKQLQAELKLLRADESYSYDRYNELREKESELISQRTFAKLSAEQRGQQQQQAPGPYEARRPYIENEFPWTMDNRYADLSQKARSIKQYLVNVDGKPDTLETDREALLTAVARFGAQFGLQAPPAPPSRRTQQFFQDPVPRSGPSRGDPMADEIEIPRDMAAGTGLDARALSAAVRSAVRGR